jgi:hypothetical protein
LPPWPGASASRRASANCCRPTGCPSGIRIVSSTTSLKPCARAAPICLLRCAGEPAIEPEAADGLRSVDHGAGIERNRELVWVGLAVGREGAVDDHLATGPKRARHVSAEPATDTVDRLAYALSVGDLRDALAHVGVLGADDLGAAQLHDLVDGGAAAHDVDRLEAEVAAELHDQLADGDPAAVCSSHSPGWTSSSLVTSSSAVSGFVTSCAAVEALIASGTATTCPASARTYCCHVPVIPTVIARWPTAMLSTPSPSASTTPTHSISSTAGGSGANPYRPRRMCRSGRVDRCCLDTDANLAGGRRWYGAGSRGSARPAARRRR